MRRDRIDFRKEWGRRPQLMLPEGEIDLPIVARPTSPSPPPLPPRPNSPYGEPVQTGRPSSREMYPGTPIRSGAIPYQPLPQGNVMTAEPLSPPPPDPSVLSGAVREPTSAEAYTQAFEDKPEKGWKEVLYQGLQALNKVFNPEDTRPITSLSEDKRQMRIARARQRYDADTAQERARQEAALRSAQTQNIYDDNIARDQRNTDLAAIAREKLQTQRLKQFTDRVWKGQKYFDPAKASELDRRELASLGLTPESIGQFDFRDPKTKTVNGVTFQWNRDQQAYVPSGLPIDGSKEIVEYKVVDPDGVPHTFKVTSDRAAGFLTSIKAAGMQIEAQATRQQAGFEHDAKMVKLRADYAKMGEAYKAKLDEIKAEKDQQRRLRLQQEAAKIQADAIRLRAQMDDQ